MKELCHEPDPARMGLLESLLQSRGIATVVEHSRENDPLGLQNLGSPRLDPALCVVDEGDFEVAKAILEEHFAGEAAAPGEEVACPSCGEKNPVNFELCWKCGKEVN